MPDLTLGTTPARLTVWLVDAAPFAASVTADNAFPAPPELVFDTGTVWPATLDEGGLAAAWLHPAADVDALAALSPRRVTLRDPASHHVWAHGTVYVARVVDSGVPSTVAPGGSIAVEQLDGAVSITYVVGEGGPGGGVTDHGDLSGLEDDDHPQYLTGQRGDARYDAAGTAAGLVGALDIPTGPGDIGAQPAGDYATSAALTAEAQARQSADAALADDIATRQTAAQVDSRVQQVVGAAPAALDTLAEIADRLADDADAVAALASTVAGKADADHAHPIGDVTGLQSALDGKQVAGSYAAATHTHDDRYYTEAEVDTALDGKADDDHTHDRRPTVQLGIFPESANPDSEAEYVAASGEPVTVMLTPYNYIQQPDVARLTALNARGVTPSISWMPNGATEGTDNPDYQLSDIIAGTHDAYMTTFLNTIKGLGFPVVIAWAPEFNGDWHAWAEGQNGNTVGQFAAAWRHVWDLADSLDVTNVEWQWAPTTSYATSTPLAGMYPGGDYVDRIAVQGYNWGAGGPDGGAKSPAELYDATFDEILAFGRGKPLWLGEIGAHDTAGDKPAWFADFFDWVINRGIAGFVWFNTSAAEQGRDWRINSSPEAAAAWTDGMAKLREVTKATGEQIAHADGPNNFTGRQNFYGAEVVGLPAQQPPTLEEIGAAPATVVNNWFVESMTLATWQAGRHLSYDSADAGTFTIPTDAAAAFPNGTTITLFQNNVGQLSVAGASGVTVRSRGGALTLAGQYAVAGLYKLGANLWTLTGDVTT